MRDGAGDRRRQHVARLQHTFGVGVACVGQRGAVVLLVVGGRRDDNRRGVRRDGLVTVFRHREGHTREVVVRVGELAVGEAHIRGTHILSGSGSRTRYGDIGIHIVERAGGRGRVARHRVHSAVIDIRAVVARDGHGHTAEGVHRQRAVGRGDGVVTGLRTLVQRVGERVGGLAGVELAARHIVRRALARDKAVAIHRHSAVGQLGAVVGLAVRGGSQRHRTLGDGDCAIVRRDVRVERLVINSVSKRVGDTRRVMGDTSRGCDAQRIGGRQAEDGAVAGDVRHRITVVGHRIAREGVLLAVVLPCLGVRLDDERIHVVGHRQRAIILGDVVVGGLRARVQRIFERIVTMADVGLAGREGVGSALTRHEPALHGERRGAVYQGVTVVGFRQVGGSEGYRTLRNAEREGGIHIAKVRAGGAGNHIQRAEIGDGRNVGCEGAAAVNAVGHRRRARAVGRTGRAGAT